MSNPFVLVPDDVGRSSGFTLITGASSGIGLELARQAAADGRNLILVARDARSLDGAADELKRRVTVHTIAEDLSQPGAAKRVFDQVRRLTPRFALRRLLHHLNAQGSQ
jgi:short-subunit dehydrogenase